MTSKTILITGATAGFGKAISLLFAKEKYKLILTGRRADRLKEISEQITGEFNVEVHTLTFDVRNKDACFNAIAGLPDTFKHIDILVNNAGLALGRDPFDTADMDDWDTMIDTNLKGLLYMTRACLPLLKESTAPHIFNLGSIAAKEVYENGNVYNATKFAVDAISKAMRIDLLPHRIKVTAIHPGAANTEFSTVRFKGDQQKAEAVYKGFEPLIADDIANTVLFVASQPLHVCINDLVIMPTAQATAVSFIKS
ncbi:SDR family NAD(P)-dependent oxidoreductase [Gynurincola endophyticus]|uniref:SDR family NAD(P)-dependent oxidoreductase n=1 Tax=Gynurincola endophyticus TaxID=2479004 RepID=UPI000F8DDD6E|nr:SDR family NAD(P)-dependent oxidoreductase [Gynurincola endophyticus]